MAKRKKADPKWMKRLSVPERHMLRVARDTLKMNDVMARVMGGPSKAEAREILRRYEMEYGRNPGKATLGGYGGGTYRKLFKRYGVKTKPALRKPLRKRHISFKSAVKAANPPIRLAMVALAGFGAYLLYRKYRQT